MPWPLGVRIMWSVYRAGVALEIINYIRDLYGSDSEVEEPQLACRRLQLVFSRTGTTPVEDDKVMTSIDFLKLDDGSFSDDWVTGDFTAVETAVDALWANMKSFVPSSYRLAEMRWYRKVPGIRFVGPPRRVVARAVEGTASGAIFPPQVALSITERTALRKHWGRMYWPYLSTASTANGRLQSAQCDYVAGQMANLYRACATAGKVPVVISDRLQLALSVREIQVDDIFDIQRSRRYRTATHRARLTAEPA